MDRHDRDANNYEKCILFRFVASAVFLAGIASGQYNHTSWSYNPPPVVPLGRGDIGKPNNTDDDYNISPRWKTFVTNNEGSDEADRRYLSNQGPTDDDRYDYGQRTDDSGGGYHTNYGNIVIPRNKMLLRQMKIYI